jgi:hypothetical protein
MGGILLTLLTLEDRIQFMPRAAGSVRNEKGAEQQLRAFLSGRLFRLEGGGTDRIRPSVTGT